MEHFHLSGEIFFEPFVLADAVVDESDGELTVDLHGPLSPLFTVEPCFRPPVDAVLAGIDAAEALDVEALDVDVEAVERVDEALAGYGVVSSFFFSISGMGGGDTPGAGAR